MLAEAAAGVYVILNPLFARRLQLCHVHSPVQSFPPGREHGVENDGQCDRVIELPPGLARGQEAEGRSRQEHSGRRVGGTARRKAPWKAAGPGTSLLPIFHFVSCLSSHGVWFISSSFYFVL